MKESRREHNRRQFFHPRRRQQRYYHPECRAEVWGNTYFSRVCEDWNTSYAGQYISLLAVFQGDLRASSARVT